MSRRRKARHAKRGPARWRLAALLVVLAAGFVWLWRAGSEWHSLRAAWLQQSAVEEPDALFRPEVGAPPYTIAVDAGPGGDDPGATGVVVEREMTAARTWAISCQLTRRALLCFDLVRLRLLLIRCAALSKSFPIKTKQAARILQRAAIFLTSIRRR